MFWPSFDDGKAANRIESLVVYSTQPALLRGALLELAHFVHNESPFPRGDMWISGRQIGPGDLQIDSRLLARLVLGVEQPQCGVPVLGPQAFLLSRDVILAPENVSP